MGPIGHVSCPRRLLMGPGGHFLVPSGILLGPVGIVTGLMDSYWVQLETAIES